MATTSTSCGYIFTVRGADLMGAPTTRTSLFDDDDALRTCFCAAPRELFLARGHVDLFYRDVTVLIEREQLLGHGRTSRVADAGSLIDADLHSILLTCLGVATRTLFLSIGRSDIRCKA